MLIIVTTNYRFKQLWFTWGVDASSTMGRRNLQDSHARTEMQIRHTRKLPHTAGRISNPTKLHHGIISWASRVACNSELIYGFALLVCPICHEGRSSVDRLYDCIKMEQNLIHLPEQDIQFA